jgi:hypothetical protein
MNISKRNDVSPIFKQVDFDWFTRSCGLALVFDVDSFDFENDGPCPIGAAGDHHVVVIGPAMHNGPALEGGINIAADGVPSLGAKRNAFAPTMVSIRRMGKILIGLPRVHERPLAHVPKIVLAIVPAENEFVADVEARALPTDRVRAILFLQLGIKLLVQDRHLHLISHNHPPY